MKLELSQKQQEEFIGRQLQFYDEMRRPRWGQVLKFSFIKGVATGFGVFLGGTLLIALLLWILSLLGNIPFLNEVIDSARESLDQSS